MQYSSLPSKQFLIRGSIAIGIVALILIVQTAWFRGLFGKKPLTLDPDSTVGEILAKDSNGNGIPDWEERLWGLDPTELYTGDMSNREIIENKKRALGLTVDGDENLNDTDKLARQLFSISTSLGQEGASLDDIGGAGAALGASVDVKSVTDHYFYKDIKTVATTKTSLTNYQQKFLTITKKYATEQVDIEEVLIAIDTGDYSGLSQITQTAVSYKAYSKELATIAIPIGVAQFHLTIINGLYGMAESFKYLADLEENPILGFKGLAIYKQYSMSYEIAGEDLNLYLIEYGIL